MSGKENIKKWRNKKEEEGYKSRNYVLHEDIIAAIETIAEETNLDKSEVVSKAIKKLVKSDYQNEIGIKKKGLEDFEETISEMSGDLKLFMQVYFEEKYEKKDIEGMKKLLNDESIRFEERGVGHFINTEKFYSVLIKNHKIMKLKSYGEYKLFLKAFDLSNPQASTDKAESNRQK
jgi:hypothetical protein